MSSIIYTVFAHKSHIEQQKNFLWQFRSHFIVIIKIKMKIWLLYDNHKNYQPYSKHLCHINNVKQYLSTYASIISIIAIILRAFLSAMLCGRLLIHEIFCSFSKSMQNIQKKRKWFFLCTAFILLPHSITSILKFSKCSSSIVIEFYC